MGLIDFEFKRERKLGEFVQDFINLLKIIYKHLILVLFRLLAVPICGIILLGYYLSTQLNTNADYSDGDTFQLVALFIMVFAFILIISLFAFGFTIEYFILLRDRKSIDFTAADIWRSFRNNVSLYFKFIAALIVVIILISVPLAFAMFLSVLIPIVGSFAVGIIFSMVGLWFFTAFMLYRENYYELIDCFGSAFSVLKAKFFEYGIASYVVTFIFQSLMSIMMIVPAIIIFIIGYNFVGFDNNFFETSYGKMVTTFGSLLVSTLFIVYYMLSVISYGIIYETAKELKFGEDVFDRISKLGKDEYV